MPAKMMTIRGRKNSDYADSTGENWGGIKSRRKMIQHPKFRQTVKKAGKIQNKFALHNPGARNRVKKVRAMRALCL